MIRINLLPARKAKRADSGQKQLVFMALAVMLGIGGVIFLHFDLTGTLETLTRDNTRIQSEIDTLKAQLGDYDKIKAQREKLLKQRESIKALEAGRTGPVFLMRELSEILTAGKGPNAEESARRDTNIGFNANWDPHRLWLDSFEETERKSKIKGSAKSTDDVAEFLKRLQASVFFNDVRIEGSTQVGTGPGAIRHFQFSITAGVLY